MSFRFPRKGSPWLSALAVLFLVGLSRPTAGCSDGTDFFGADENKIKETPKYLKICHRSDKNLDECIKSSLEKFMETVNTGPEELNLPNLDPIEIPSLEFQLGSGNVSLHMTFKDFKIYGFKDFKIMNVRSNLMDSKFEIAVENPLIVMSAQFTSEGGVFMFPISAQGDFYLNLTDVSAVLIFHMTTKTVSPGLSFFAVEKCIMDIISSEIDGHFGEFVDGSNVIGEAFNDFFNSNAHEVFTVIKPKISESLSGIFASIADEILSKHPDYVLLPD